MVDVLERGCREGSPYISCRSVGQGEYNRFSIPNPFLLVLFVRGYNLCVEGYNPTHTNCILYAALEVISC